MPRTSIGQDEAIDHRAGVHADASSSPPRLALAIATSLGLGYLPMAPGTWGSMGGLALAALLGAFLRAQSGDAVVAAELALVLFAAFAGLWSSSLVARFSRAGDPQYVVIDEVSGQTIALILGLALPAGRADTAASTVLASGLLNWKYLLLGFILFRIFDIWKPFPARQAESLPGGLGIMADDWIAGGYAALALWFARHYGL